MIFVYHYVMDENEMAWVIDWVNEEHNDLSELADLFPDAIYFEAVLVMPEDVISEVLAGGQAFVKKREQAHQPNLGTEPNLLEDLWEHERDQEVVFHTIKTKIGDEEHLGPRETCGNPICKVLRNREKNNV